MELHFRAERAHPTCPTSHQVQKAPGRPFGWEATARKRPFRSQTDVPSPSHGNAGEQFPLKAGEISGSVIDRGDPYHAGVLSRLGDRCSRASGNRSSHRRVLRMFQGRRMCDLGF